MGVAAATGATGKVVGVAITMEGAVVGAANIGVVVDEAVGAVDGPAPIIAVIAAKQIAEAPFAQDLRPQNRTGLAA